MDKEYYKSLAKAILKFLGGIIGSGFAYLIVVGGILIGIFNVSPGWLFILLWLVCMFLFGYGWASDDIKDVKRELARRNEIKKQKMEVLRQEKIYQERRKLINEMEQFKGYELNIIPFLELLIGENGKKQSRLNEVLGKVSENVNSMRAKADDLNRAVEALGGYERVHIHNR